MNSLNDSFCNECRELIHTMNEVIASDYSREELLTFIKGMRDGLAVIVGNPDAPKPGGVIDMRGKCA